MDLATITKEAVKTRIPWAAITSCVSQELQDGSRQVTIVLECPTPGPTATQALEECFTGLGYDDVNVYCRALDKEDNDSVEKWEFEVFGTYPRRLIWHPSSGDSQASAEQSMREVVLPANKFVVTPDKDMLLTHVIQDRSYLRAERWLLANRIPMEVCEGHDDEGNECIDHVFRTDEGPQLIMREDNNDTMSFFLKFHDGRIETVEPSSPTARFCSFVPMKDGEASGPTVFITHPDLKSQYPRGETPCITPVDDSPFVDGSGKQETGGEQG